MSHAFKDMGVVFTDSRAVFQMHHPIENLPLWIAAVHALHLSERCTTEMSDGGVKDTGHRDIGT